MNREEFEKLPEIANELKNSDGELYFCETESRYKNHRVFQDAQTGYLNGAWYAWQEQQKKIDDLNLKTQDLISKYEGKTTLPILDQWSDCFVKSARGMVNDLKELLK